MSSSVPGLIDLVGLAAIVGLFLLPGWLLGRCIPTPFPVLTTFLGAAVIFFNGLLLLDAIGAGIDYRSVVLFLVLTAAVLVPVSRRASPAAPPVKPAGSPARADWPWVVLSGLALGSIIIRAFIDPLSGWDNSFRWNYLAELLLSQGSLAHYPAVSAADFEVYGWCDGIPPLVSELNFLLYLGGGMTPALTAGRVATEAILTGVALHRLARMFWGEAAGWPGLAVAASSPLLLWSFANGQETGLLTLCLVTLVLLLETHRRQPGVATACWAGIAAGAGAVTRDYALAYVLLGGVALAGQRPGRTPLLAYALAAVGVAGPWYLRNALLTGNPLFPHTLGGWLPTNPAYVEVTQAIAAQWGVHAGRFDPASLPQLIALLAGPAFVLGLAGAWRAWPRHRVATGGVALVVVLWWWALPFTAGGWIYACRVLAPAVALSGALGGWIAGWPRTARLALFLVLSAFVVDAGRRSWMLPTGLATPPLPYSWTQWQENRARVAFQARAQVWAVLIPAAQGRGIAVDQPALHAWVAQHGGRPVPWFSPDFRAAFDDTLSAAETQRRLRAANLRFITFSNDDIVTQELRQRNPFFRALTEGHAPNVRVLGLDIYDLDQLQAVP